VKLVLLVLTGWLVLSVLVAVTAGKVIKVYQESQVPQVRPVRLVHPAPRAIRDLKVR